VDVADMRTICHLKCVFMLELLHTTNQVGVCPYKINRYFYVGREKEGSSARVRHATQSLLGL
jgi:hypothetical protein